MVKKKAACPCSHFFCPRHGKCDECRKYHEKKGISPHCERIRKEEK